MNYAVGQLFRAKCNIYQPADGDSPGLVLAHANDILIVRSLSVMKAFACYVSHVDVTDGRAFGVLAEEIEPLDDVLETGGGDEAQAAAAARGDHDDMIREYDNRPDNDAREDDDCDSTNPRN